MKNQEKSWGGQEIVSMAARVFILFEYQLFYCFF